MATLKIRNATNTGWVDGAAATGFKVRNAANTGWVDKTGTLANVKARAAGNASWLSMAGGGGGVTYSITPTTTSVNEGSSVTFNIVTSGVGTGTLYWTNAGTTSASDFSGGVNSGTITITSDTGALVLTLTNDATTEGSETAIIQLRTVSTSGTVVATASTVTVNDTSTTPVAPTSLTLARNDLDFVYAPTATSSVSTPLFQFECRVNTTTFFANGGNHVAFCIDATGGQGSSNPHCGPIYRNGQNLWATGRGFIIFGDGTVMAEEWNGTSSPGLATVGTFNRAANPHFFVRIKAGYRAGALANTMQINVLAADYTMLLNTSVPWGWDWSGTHRAAVAAIAPGFVSPNSTGCVETTAAGSAPSATVPFSDMATYIF